MKPMKTTTSISFSEIVLLVALAVSILLPRAVLPFGLLVTGGGYLFYTILHSIHTNLPPKSSFGPLTAAAFIFIFGICLLLIPSQTILALIISLVATVILQMAWVVIKNRVIGK